MSQSAATLARPARRPLPSRPTLQLVTPVGRQQSNLPFVLLCSFVLAAGLVVVLFLNMQLSAGSYEMDRLQKRSDLAADNEAKLREDLAVESATGRLAERATALGMVPGVAPMFLSLSDGKILGVAPQDPANDPLKVVVDGSGAAVPTSGATTSAPSASASGAADSASTATPSARASGVPAPSATASRTARQDGATARATAAPGAAGSTGSTRATGATGR